MTTEDSTAASGPIAATMNRDEWVTIISIMRVVLRMMPDAEDLARLSACDAADAARMGLRVCDVMLKLAHQVAPSTASQHGAAS